MEKTVQPDPREAQAIQSADQEAMQAWAQIGVLLEQIEQARRARDQAVQKQQGVVRQIFAAHGIERYNGFRPGPNGALIVTVPDEQEVILPAEAKPNGAPQPHIETAN